jgi:hypothetical protein
MKVFFAWADDFYLRPAHRSAELLDRSYRKRRASAE